jgi:hypothetical protein
MARRLKAWWPAVLALIVASGYAVWRMAPAGFDPTALAEIGPRFSLPDPGAEPGYDGQFTLYIALDPDPASVAAHLDVPAYRFQRILLPFLARVLSLAHPALIPWMILAINMVALVVGTRLLTGLLINRGLAPGYALIYGLWVGSIAPVGLDLHEPLAYGLVILGWSLADGEHERAAGLALGAALFAKETTILFWLAMLLAFPSRGWTRGRTWLIGAGAAFLAWQLWLWKAFGAPGLGSGGDMATGFELIPYMGLWRIGEFGWKVLLLFAVLLVPTIIIPSILGTLHSARAWLIEKSRDYDTLALGFNSAILMFTPHSTFREPLGIVRLATGMVLALVLYGSRAGRIRALNLGLFWIAFLFLLVRQT